MPGFGRRWVELWRFNREGLTPLARQPSQMFTNRRLGGRAHPIGDDIRDRCDGCQRAFSEMYGGKLIDAPRNMEMVLLRAPDETTLRAVCWSCAADRDRLIDICGPAFANCIAEDGQDVFAVVAQTILEDRLADQPGYDERLACHSNYPVLPKYRNTIDGRLKSFEERRQ